MIEPLVSVKLKEARMSTHLGPTAARLSSAAMKARHSHRWASRAATVATVFLTVMLNVPAPGLAAGSEAQTAAPGSQVPTSGYGELRRVWVLTTDERFASESGSPALPAGESALQYELRCEAGRLQFAQRSFSDPGAGDGKTWTVTVNAGLLSRAGASVLTAALEKVCGV